MLLQLQLLLAWLLSAQGINFVFALLMLASAIWDMPRTVALISALLYLALVLV